MLGEVDGVEDGSQNAQKITLVGGPGHSYFGARMGFCPWWTEGTLWSLLEPG